MSSEFISWIVIAGSAIGSFIANLLFKFFGNSIDALFERWRFANADMRKLANEILDLCAEAQSTKYRKLPDDEKKIHKLLNYLESIESNVLELLVGFYNNWVTTVIVLERAESKDEQTFAQQLVEDTEKRRKELVKAVGKWKK
ncbi:MAG: hypothetical protein H0W89_03825 [Candidatus Levybacteria bacterium]|nr:hypothetical protein [Candidatus Levybacteria bacterium]